MNIHKAKGKEFDEVVVVEAHTKQHFLMSGKNRYIRKAGGCFALANGARAFVVD
jgi:ATP-dependent exoDNAse (exonuclease V) beta subunit